MGLKLLEVGVALAGVAVLTKLCEVALDASKYGEDDDRQNVDHELTDEEKWQITLEHIRRATACRFCDGVSMAEFRRIVQEVRNIIDRIIECEILEEKATAICKVRSQSGATNWQFVVDFNDWGRMTGKYKIITSNDDSSIPVHFAQGIASIINRIQNDRGFYVSVISDDVEENDKLKGKESFEIHHHIGLLERKFHREKHIVIPDSAGLVGEHFFPVFSYLQKAGFRNIKCECIKDIDNASPYYPYEISELTIGGYPYSGGTGMGVNTFSEYAPIEIKYHLKKEITIPFKLKELKEGTYEDTCNRLISLGFVNVQALPLKDLIKGWLKTSGTVSEITVDRWVVEGNGTQNIDVKQVYPYDVVITVKYHSFKNGT